MIKRSGARCCDSSMIARCNPCPCPNIMTWRTTRHTIADRRGGPGAGYCWFSRPPAGQAPQTSGNSVSRFHSSSRSPSPRRAFRVIVSSRLTGELVAVLISPRPGPSSGARRAQRSPADRPSRRAVTTTARTGSQEQEGVGTGAAPGGGTPVIPQSRSSRAPPEILPRRAPAEYVQRVPADGVGASPGRCPGTA